MRAGRPTSYDSKFCEVVRELGKEGASKAEMAAACGVSRPTFDAWADANPEFLYAVKESLLLAQAWWERQGRLATFGMTEGFNATSFIFNMKNRFPEDWRDKTEQHVTVVSHEDALAALK